MIHSFSQVDFIKFYPLFLRLSNEGGCPLMSRILYETSEKGISVGQDTEGRAEKVLERIPLIGSCSKVNPFK
jgi:hypothetical protein